MSAFDDLSDHTLEELEYLQVLLRAEVALRKYQLRHPEPRRPEPPGPCYGPDEYSDKPCEYCGNHPTGKILRFGGTPVVSCPEIPVDQPMIMQRKDWRPTP